MAHAANVSANNPIFFKLFILILFYVLILSFLRLWQLLILYESQQLPNLYFFSRLLQLPQISCSNSRRARRYRDLLPRFAYQHGDQQSS